MLNKEIKKLLETNSIKEIEDAVSIIYNKNQKKIKELKKDIEMLKDQISNKYNKTERN